MGYQMAPRTLAPPEGEGAEGHEDGTSNPSNQVPCGLMTMPRRATKKYSRSRDVDLDPTPFSRHDYSQDEEGAKVARIAVAEFAAMERRDAAGTDSYSETEQGQQESMRVQSDTVRRPVEGDDAEKRRSQISCQDNMLS